MEQKRKRTSSLTKEQKKEVRDLYETKQYSYTLLGKMYGVCSMTIERIINDPDGTRYREQKSERAKNSRSQLNKYRRENNKQIIFRLHKQKDAELIAFIESKENIRQYLCKLIKEDMEKEKQNEQTSPEESASAEEFSSVETP